MEQHYIALYNKTMVNYSTVLRAVDSLSSNRAFQSSSLIQRVLQQLVCT